MHTQFLKKCHHPFMHTPQLRDVVWCNIGSLIHICYPCKHTLIENLR